MVLTPALLEISNKGTLLFGPFSADSFFGSRTHEKYDAILAIYHDQGLIPFKTLSFGEGVNYTAGLNKIRTSPDHGTAYDIAGKNWQILIHLKMRFFLQLKFSTTEN